MSRPFLGAARPILGQVEAAAEWDEAAEAAEAAKIPAEIAALLRTDPTADPSAALMIERDPADNWQAVGNSDKPNAGAISDPNVNADLMVEAAPV